LINALFNKNKQKSILDVGDMSRESSESYADYLFDTDVYSTYEPSAPSREALTFLGDRRAGRAVFSELTDALAPDERPDDMIPESHPLDTLSKENQVAFWKRKGISAAAKRAFFDEASRYEVPTAPRGEIVTTKKEMNDELGSFADSNNIFSYSDLLDPDLPYPLAARVTESFEFISMLSVLASLRGQGCVFKDLEGDIKRHLYSMGLHHVNANTFLGEDYALAQLCIDYSYELKVEEKRERTEDKKNSEEFDRIIQRDDVIRRSSNSVISSWGGRKGTFLNAAGEENPNTDGAIDPYEPDGDLNSDEDENEDDIRFRELINQSGKSAKTVAGDGGAKTAYVTHDEREMEAKWMNFARHQRNNNMCQIQDHKFKEYLSERLRILLEFVPNHHGNGGFVIERVLFYIAEIK
jgi:hypothetical protein